MNYLPFFLTFVIIVAIIALHANHTNGVAIKDDLKDIENRMATKEDSEKLEKRVTNIENRMATKEDIKSLRWMIGVSFTLIALLLGTITIILTIAIV